ncbi:MAG: DUF4918 family protein [Chitinophagaceae bacterium]|nr:DUF4918 family protein [Chitinophagaceae bacterium]
MTTATQIISFLFNLNFTPALPANVEVMQPFTNDETQRVCNIFYNKYYSDTQHRNFIIGINPGRFGGGVTGIPFTDPIRLKIKLNIDNYWPTKQELSSVFIYDMIEAYGGAEAFYGEFYFTSLSPLGFTRHGKNLNYYDDKELVKSIEPFAATCMQQQLAWARTSVAFCLGEGDNYKFINKFNNEYRFFKKIVPLAHPRFIMQYKLKSKQAYIDKYLEALTSYNDND